jgi:hypothetical protein
MSMLPLTPDELVQLAAHGGGFDVDAAQLSQADIVRIASYAGTTGGKIVVNNARQIPFRDLTTIASYGKGNVVFHS